MNRASIIIVLLFSVSLGFVSPSYGAISKGKIIPVISQLLLNNASRKTATPTATADDISFNDVTVSSSSVTFTWDQMNNSDCSAIKYSVLRDGTVVSSFKGELTDTSVTFPGLDADTVYTFVIKTYASDRANTFKYEAKFATLAEDSTEIDYSAINTAADLESFAGFTNDYQDDYMLMFDISLADYPNWNPIGYNSDYAYAGDFNGAGHTISDLTFSSSFDYVGLFGYCRGTITNLGVVGCDITGTSTSSSSEMYVGGLVAANFAPGVIDNCYVTGSVSSTVYESHIGGLVGLNYDATITNSYAQASVSSSSNYSYIGGLVGENYNESTGTGAIEDCYATGDVFSSSSVKSFIGGFVGLNNNAPVFNSYATGAVSSTSEYSYIGGFVGQTMETRILTSYATGTVTCSGNAETGGFAGYVYTGIIKNCYETGDVSAAQGKTGGFVGHNDSAVEYCYEVGSVSMRLGAYVGGFTGYNEKYGILLANHANKDNNESLSLLGGGEDYSEGSYLTTSQMKDAENYSTYYSDQSDWDFDDTWMFGALNNGYPYLQENKPVQ